MNVKRLIIIANNYQPFMYSGRESNPYGHFCPQDFKSCVSTYSTTRASFCRFPNFFKNPVEIKNSIFQFIQKNLSFAERFCRAENETRTRDPNLGKVMLYQLSYFRVWDCKSNKIFASSKKFKSQYQILLGI